MVTLEDENLSTRARYLRDIAQGAVGDLSGGRCLAVGSGTGYNVTAFGREYGEVHALEAVPKEFPDAVDHGVFADGTRLPYRDDAFDFIFAISVVEHVLPPTRRPDLIEEMVRCTAPGGHVLLQIPNRRFVVELHSGLPFIQWLPNGERLGIRLGYESLRDIHIPSFETLQRWVEAAGADVIEARGITYPAAAIPKYHGVYDVLKRLGVFRAMPFGYVVVARV